MIIHVSSRYFCTLWRHGRWQCKDDRRAGWLVPALGASWTYTGQNLSPTTRYTHVRVSHSYQTLSAVAVCQDHQRALQACILGAPVSWRRRIGHPRQSCLRTVEADLRPMNLRLLTTKGRAMTDQLGGNSWQRLRRLRHAPQDRSFYK